jgi:L-fucose isomerase
MNKPKTALITFGDHRKNEWEKVFQNLTEPRHEKLIENLKKMDIDLICNEAVARSRDDITRQVKELKARGAECLLAHTPCWTSPNLVVYGVQQAGLPTGVVGNRDPGTHGCVGTFGASGALWQIGFDHKVFRDHYDSPELAVKILPFARAAAAKARLNGSVFGYFGGRSIGIDTSQFDAMQWRKEFGVDAEHIDQSEIIFRAESIEQSRVDKMRSWIEGTAKEVVYNDTKMTREKFDFQIACYLATKDICRDLGLEFTAVKCMPELSNNFVPQCMTAAFLPNNYDGEEGEKESTVMACEADADGALTQQILKIVSGGKPTLFADVSHIDNDRKTIYCINCGALCAWYAGRCGAPADNMKKITVKQSIRPGGGGITFFTAEKGPMQLARLYRHSGKYRMAIIPCEAVTPEQEVLDELIEARGPHQLPVLFAKVGFDIEAFTQEYASNHISGVDGHYTEELVELCTMLGIEPVVFA